MMTFAWWITSAFRQENARYTSKSVEEIAIATERDNYMTAKEAMDFGLIDKIIDRR